MSYYNRDEVALLKESRKGSYLVIEGFNRGIRLELKWAYISIFNLMLDEPLYNEENIAYINEDLSKMSQSLATLANKKVDEEKMKGYVDELVEADLLDVRDNAYYLKKVRE